MQTVRALARVNKSSNVSAMARVISNDFSPAGIDRLPASPAAGKVLWSGVIMAIQSRAWVWRYKTDNRTHNLSGFNLWVKGGDGKIVVAISALQQQKLGFRHGDTASGTAWPVQGKNREIANLYRAGDLKVIDQPDRNADQGGPPLVDTIPDIEIYQQRDCRMLDATPCLWANKSCEVGGGGCGAADGKDVQAEWGVLAMRAIA